MPPKKKVAYKGAIAAKAKAKAVAVVEPKVDLIAKALEKAKERAAKGLPAVRARDAPSKASCSTAKTDPSIGAGPNLTRPTV